MAHVLSGWHPFWDVDGLVWTSRKNSNGNKIPGFFGHVTIERETTDATTATLKVWAWHDMNVGDMSGSGWAEVWDYDTSSRFAYVNYSATIGREPTLLLQAPMTGIGPDFEFFFLATIRFNGVDLAQIEGWYVYNAHAYTPSPALASIVRTETDASWVFEATYTGTDHTGTSLDIVLVAESGNKSVEVHEFASGASTPTIKTLTIPKTQLKEVLKASVGVFDSAHRALLVQEWERVVPPLFHVSNQYERSIGIGCHAAEQPNTVKFAPDMEVIGIGGYSTTPVRMGRYLDTPYSVYKVVVPFPGSSLSESFTAPAEIQCLLTISGIGQSSSTGYWFPIPHSSLSAFNAMSSFRCTIIYTPTGNSCLVEVRNGSSVKYVNDTVKAIVEFVC